MALVVYAGLLGLTYWEFTITPKGFVPPQDMGYLIVSVQMPDAASAERTRAITDQIQDICHEHAGVEHTAGGRRDVVRLPGQRLELRLDVRDSRRFRQTRGRPDFMAEEIANTLRKRLAAEIPGARVSVFDPVPIRGAGRTGGFSAMVEDRRDRPSALQNPTC